MRYVETEIDGVPATFMDAVLCDSCYAYAANQAKMKRAERTHKKGSLEGHFWKRKITSTPIEGKHG